MNKLNSRPSKRIERAKSDFTPNRSSEAFKSRFRNRFMTRIKLSRSQSVDQFRKMFDDIENIEYNCINELKKILMEAPEARYLLNDNELNKIMDEIQKELLDIDLEREATRLQMETEDIVKRHLNICGYCEQADTQELLCLACSMIVNQEFRD